MAPSGATLIGCPSTTSPLRMFLPAVLVTEGPLKLMESQTGLFGVTLSSSASVGKRPVVLSAGLA